MAIEIFHDKLTAEDLAWFRGDFDRLIDVDPEDRPFFIEDSQRIYGVSVDKIDRRHILTENDESFVRMRDIIYTIVPKGTAFYMAYQRQFLPHQLHVDGIYPYTDLKQAKSAIVPLDENPNGIFKTIIWNKVFITNEELQSWFHDFIDDNTKFPKVSTVSSEQDVDHCWGSDPSIVDTMLLEGTYEYELGTIGMFDRTHVHCSSNWRKYRLVDHKDIILLHIG